MSGAIRRGTYFPPEIPSSTLFVPDLEGSNLYMATIARPETGSRYSIHGCVIRNPVTMVIQRAKPPPISPSTTPAAPARTIHRSRMPILARHFQIPSFKRLNSLSVVIFITILSHSFVAGLKNNRTHLFQYNEKKVFLQ